MNRIEFIQRFVISNLSHEFPREDVVKIADKYWSDINEHIRNEEEYEERMKKISNKVWDIIAHPEEIEYLSLEK